MINLQEARQELLKLKGKPKLERMLTTAAILTELLEQQQIRKRLDSSRVYKRNWSLIRKKREFKEWIREKEART